MKGKQVGLVAAMAVAFLTIGCGKQEGKKLASESGTVEAGVLEQPVRTASLVQTLPQSDGASAVPATADSLPPDVVASASALVAERGQVVEITAQGSLDINGVVLSDGLHKTPLVYDMDAKAWRGIYRVPLRTKADRVGLAVTATNSQGRWQRVWVFIGVGTPGMSGGEKTDADLKTGTEESTQAEQPSQETAPAQGVEPTEGTQPAGTDQGADF